MRKDEEQFLKNSLESFRVLADKKYRKGVKQHGGYIWKKPDLIEQLEQELVDSWHYVQGFKKMIKDLGISLGEIKYLDKDLCKKQKNNIFVGTAIRKLLSKKKK